MADTPKYTLVRNDITRMHPSSGRVLKEDSQFVNIVDLLRGINVNGDPVRVQLVDSFGRRSIVSEAGEMIVANRNDDISVNFQYGVSIYDIKDGGVVTGTGSLGQSGAMATLSTGTGVGSATLETMDPVRYRAGHESYCAPSVVFSTPEVNVNQYVGFLNGTDALAVGYQGTTFGIWFIEGGNVNFIAQADWNIDKLDGTGRSGYTLNPLAGQVPEVKYIWHGLRNLTVEFIDEDGNALAAHKFDFINDATDVHLENPSLPVAAKIERTSGTGANLTMKVGSFRAGVVSGREEDNASNRWFSRSQLEFPIVAGVNNNVFTIRNETTFNSKVNHIVVELGVVDFVNDANKTLSVYGVYNATLAGNGAYTSISAGESVLSVSTGGTYSGGRVGPAAPVRGGDQRTREVLGTGIKIYPGQTFTFGVPAGAAVNGTFTIVARIKEYH